MGNYDVEDVLEILEGYDPLIFGLTALTLTGHKPLSLLPWPRKTAPHLNYSVFNSLDGISLSEFELYGGTKGLFLINNDAIFEVMDKYYPAYLYSTYKLGTDHRRVLNPLNIALKNYLRNNNLDYGGGYLFGFTYPNRLKKGIMMVWKLRWGYLKRLDRILDLIMINYIVPSKEHISYKEGRSKFDEVLSKFARKLNSKVTFKTNKYDFNMK